MNIDHTGKQKLTCNSWAVCVIPGRRGGKPDKAAVQDFIKDFCRIYASHGGRIENTQPAMALASGDDVGTWVTSTWNAAGNQSQSRPQILMFVLPGKTIRSWTGILGVRMC
jgi:eukaryotic translation initiation factor 2C